MFNKLKNEYILYIINGNTKLNNKVKLFLNKNDLNNIKIFKSGESAINTIKNGEIPDLILVNYVLPGISGIEASQKIKTINSSITVICVASGDKEDITLPLRILASGCDDWLSKNDSFSFFITKIHKWLKIKEKQLQIKNLLEDRRYNKRLNAISILEAGLS